MTTRQEAKEEARAKRLGNEIMVTDSSTGGQKGVKLATFHLVPAGPLWLLAEHYGKNSKDFGGKYEARNWELGYPWSASYSAAKRHLDQFWLGEDIDQESGTPHPIAAAWHCFALTEFMHVHPDKDDRPHKGAWLPWEG